MGKTAVWSLPEERSGVEAMQMSPEPGEVMMALMPVFDGHSPVGNAKLVVLLTPTQEGH